MSGTFPKLFKNSFYLLVMNLGTLGALFVFSVLLARTLGQEALGLYALFTATLMLFSYAVDLGQSTSLVQEMGRAPAAGNRILKNTLLLKMLLSLAATAGLLLFSLFYFQKTEERSLFLIFGLMLLPRGLGATFEAAFRSRQKMAFLMWANVGHGALLVFASWGQNGISHVGECGAWRVAGVRKLGAAARGLCLANDHRPAGFARNPQDGFAMAAVSLRGKLQVLLFRTGV
ncbi:hypothetical protein DCC62_30170 [candidate division KSB1 bacterium]|nr:MAG: hypothetical protein DCC62_30170 [candidate division KSB1 bacterium]